MFVVEVSQERALLCNAHPTYSEPVCMPEFSSCDEQQIYSPGSYTYFHKFPQNILKTCLKRPLKMDITKVFMENRSLMKVESIAECSLWMLLWSILQY